MKQASAFPVFQCALVMVAILGAASATHAQTPPPQVLFVVDTTADLIDDDVGDGICHTSLDNCSLRAAVIQANHLTTPGIVAEISVPAGVFILTRTQGSSEEDYDLDLSSPLGIGQQTAILGAGAGRTIIDGNHASHVIYIEANRNVILRDLTIRNGYANSGAGIFNGGALVVVRTWIEGNQASLGGGLYGSEGGGIYTTDQGSLAIRDSIVRANDADYGGGLYSAGSLQIRGSTLSGNAADNGGGLYNTGSLAFIDSTISNNHSLTDGGGIYSDSDAFFYSASVIGNIADYDHDINGGLGGGLYAEPGARFVLVNSLIAGNAVNAGFTDSDCDGTFESYGYNLLGEAVRCNFTGNGLASIGFVSLNSIGPLQDNGGPSPTHALLGGSEAIDAATSQGCIDETGALLAVDQRGAPRVAGLRCDIGAFEYGAVVDRIFRSGFEPGS